MISVFPSRAVAASILGFQIHWYGIMYLLAFLLAYVLVLRFQKFRNLSLTHDDVATILSWAIGGVIIGGRLGYVLFYDPAYYLAHPPEVLFVWNGGMSSHGGFIGVTLALWYILRKRGVPLLPFLDVATVPIAVGLALGRFGNFINWELYGTVTDVPWAIAIPGVEGLRHPTFFYSMIQNLWIATVCLWILRSGKGRVGVPFAVFLIAYAVLRFTIEHFRVQTSALTEIGILTLTRGQVLTIPILLIGLTLLWKLRR